MAPPRDTHAVTTFIERCATTLTEGGIPRMPARVFAALLTSDTGQLTAAQLARTLTASPAAVSGAVRYLRTAHLITRERAPGTRHDTFHVQDNVWHEAVFSRDQLLQHWADTFRAGATALGPHTPAGRRLTETHHFFDFLRAEMPALMRRWKHHRQTLDHTAGR